MPDQPLRRLVDAIVAGDYELFSELIHESPALAKAGFSEGATRQGIHPSPYFLEAIGHYIYSGDTALHYAAAAYRQKMAVQLIHAGAGVRARNRRGSEPFHAAAVGSPNSATWDPGAQGETLVCLIEGGADVNAQNMDGATALHLAIRTRCAGAVRTLLDRGANPEIRNKKGSTARQLALHNTGRPGSGSPEAKEQLQEIVVLLQR